MLINKNAGKFTRITGISIILILITWGIISTNNLNGSGIWFINIENGISAINDDELLTAYMDSPANITQQEIYSGDFFNKYIPIDINIAANSKFMDLTDEEKYDVMSKAVFHIRNYINNSSTTPYFNTDCGKKNFKEYQCRLDYLRFTDGTNSYSFDLNPLNNRFLTLNFNGIDVYPSEEDVYNFMERKYAEMTNYENVDYIDNYVYEESILKMTDLKFNISETDAKEILKTYGDYDLN